MSSHRQILFVILFVVVSYKCSREDTYLLLCEGHEKTVSCPNDFIINIVSASYGYNGSNAKARKECDDWKNTYIRDTDNTDCHLPESTNILTDKCNGHSECTVTANNEIFGDPCRGTTKYFELFYNCKQDEGENGMPTVTPKLNGEVGDDGGMDEENQGMNDDSGWDSESKYSSEQNMNIDERSMESEYEDDGDDDNDDDDDDDDDGNGLSPVTVVAIAAGIPVGLIIIIVILVVSLICFLLIKRRKKSAISRDRNMSANQYTSQGLTMTTDSSKNEDSEMVYNTSYQSVGQDGQSAVKTGIGPMGDNYENSPGIEYTNENVKTDEEETVYNETYQSVEGNGLK